MLNETELKFQQAIVSKICNLNIVNEIYTSRYSDLIILVVENSEFQLEYLALKLRKLQEESPFSYIVFPVNTVWIEQNKVEKEKSITATFGGMSKNQVESKDNYELVFKNTKPLDLDLSEVLHLKKDIFKDGLDMRAGRIKTKQQSVMDINGVKVIIG